MTKPPAAILESAVYVDDLDRAQAFYGGVLGLELIGRAGNRHIFYRCGDGILLVFNASETEKPYKEGQLPVPPHGARGPGHLCFRADGTEIDAWRRRLVEAGVTVESELEWPDGGRSIYFRDPSGNSLEFAEARIWGID